MPTWALLLSINVMLLIMGSFLEPPAAILILTPLLLPLVQAVGVNPVHFGIIMAVNLSIGMYTPPFGLNLFASQAVFQIAARHHLSRRAAVSGDQFRDAAGHHLRAVDLDGAARRLGFAPNTWIDASRYRDIVDQPGLADPRRDQEPDRPVASPDATGCSVSAWRASR